MAILKKNGELQQQKFDFLLRGPKVMGMENPLKEWVLDSTWGSVQALKASDPCRHCIRSNGALAESLSPNPSCCVHQYYTSMTKQLPCIHSTP